MKLFSYILITFALAAVSCDTSQYSEDEEERLQEAQRLHNEALAIFSETKDLLAEVTEVRSELQKQYGIEEENTASSAEGTANQSGDTKDTTGNDQNNESATKDTGQEGVAEPKVNERTNDPSANQSKDSLNVDSQKALDDINKAQGDLLTWMRNIYSVPEIEGGYDADQKAKDSRSIGKDPNSPRLTTDIEFQDLPANASVDENYEKQKEQKEKILQIQEDLKRAIQNARKNY